MLIGQTCTLKPVYSILDHLQFIRESLTELVIQIGKWNPGKEEKEDLKFINDKLLSNSYQAGFENIKHDIEMQEVYQILKKDKLNDKLDVTDLEKRLIDLEKFLQVQGNIYYEKCDIYIY